MAIVRETMRCISLIRLLENIGANDKNLYTNAIEGNQTIYTLKAHKNLVHHNSNKINNYSQKTIINAVNIIKKQNKESAKIVNNQHLKTKYSNQSHILSKDLVKKLHQRKANINYQYQLASIPNQGNTCYLATAIKCISCYPPFIQGYTVNENIKHKPIVNFGKQLQSLFTNLRKSTPININAFKNALGEIDPTFQGNSQQDCYQAIITMLDNAHLASKKYRFQETPKFLTQRCDGTNYLIQSESVIENGRTTIREHNSIVYDTFLSMNVLEYNCHKCKDAKVPQMLKIEIVTGIPLDIAGKDNLLQCIEQYLGAEIYSNYRCSRCGPSDMSINRKPVDLPPILIFQLKRFKLNDKNEYVKDNTDIRYPIYEEPLSLGNYFSAKDTYKSSEIKHIYYLLAVGVHSGTLKFGHYYAYLLNLTTKKWELHNDGKISIVDPKEARTRDAISLVYIRKDHKQY